MSKANQSRKEVRLSQVMIVKNEERHIERALEWAKDIAFEQIVVDTGSTDRTVELAEKMGAVVHHFEWINDFGAAKNFAMNKAKGNWIAILDADEYMPREDANELMSILKKIQSNPAEANQYDGVQNSWVQLDDNNNVTSTLTNIRVFRNSPELRYEGKIHEAVRIRNKVYDALNLRIMHTGYAASVYKETNKKERNLELLRSEHERDPENPDIMIYLADSLKAESTPQTRQEAEELYLKALSGERKGDKDVKQLAYDFLIPRFTGDKRIEDGKTDLDMAMKLCNAATLELPGHIDYFYYRGIINNTRKNYKEALDDLLICEKAFITGTTLPKTRVLFPSPMPLFYYLKAAAKGVGDQEALVRGSTILHSMLSEFKGETEIIGSFIKSLLLLGVSENDVLDELAEAYNLNDPRDLLFIAKASKEAGAIGFTRKIMDIASKVME